MDDRNIIFMKRALELAALGKGSVSPNPMVGCVIVHKDKIIGEGYHQNYGEAHAEVKAIKSVADQRLLSESTVYVTLEPCSHYGKTPPCADLLIEKEIEKIVIASKDPFESVNGQGIQRLMDAGIETVVGVLEKEADEQNRRFMTSHQKNRPYIVLKWAQTSDGFIAKDNYDSKWISNDKSRQLVHKWRAEEDAILVGKNTALHDNPSLTVRHWSGRNPLRILLDKDLEINEDSNLYDSDADTIIFNSKLEKEIESNRWIKLQDFSIEAILGQLQQLSVQSVIVEGGAQILNSFIKNNCWDEARVFTANQKFGAGIESPSMEWEPTNESTVLDDNLKLYRNNNG